MCVLGGGGGQGGGRGIGLRILIGHLTTVVGIAHFIIRFGNVFHCFTVVIL